MSDVQRTQHTLLSTTDPMIWAEEFCRIFHGHTISANESREGIDAGLMVGWFANAMATALALHNQEVDAEVEEITEGDELDELDDDLTLEEQFREGFDEGRRE